MMKMKNAAASLLVLALLGGCASLSSPPSPAKLEPIAQIAKKTRGHYSASAGHNSGFEYLGAWRQRD